MSRPADPPRPACPQCGEPIGAYEPVWWIGPLIGATETSWLNLRRPLAPSESLWHRSCAETDGVDGG
jgi:hypothetical protein